MAYPNSELVDPSVVQASGCLTTLPVRCSKHLDLANSASRALCLEWNNAGVKGDLRRSSFDPKGNALSLSIPECLPERVEVCTRLLDIGFYNDGLVPMLDTRLTWLTTLGSTRPARGLERSWGCKYYPLIVNLVLFRLYRL